MQTVAVICLNCFPSSPRGIDIINIPPPSLSNRGGRGEREEREEGGGKDGE